MTAELPDTRYKRLKREHGCVNVRLYLSPHEQAVLARFRRPGASWQVAIREMIGAIGD